MMFYFVHLFNHVPINQLVWVHQLNTIILIIPYDELAVGLKVVSVIILDPWSNILEFPPCWLVVSSIVVVSPVLTRCMSSRVILKVQQMIVVLLFSSRVKN